ncbi:TPA: tyrosinase family protein [Bacillus wiedmannii]|uniref:tyrosinase family protein n=1 Tax=Bacillus wiedmannii TaxID=1890302 RepID=UPI0021D00134|nr:tyrosinase family protein [Bacillus wiedmannii]MCU5577854.1 tyrosinase family protein [Bacillus wiedmannii]WMS85250.1 tyrosinase family protein [Bacillus wiedmannii]HDR7671410.1 tyrosinase family protein [Bacillus wiedmannii]HDR7677146.1 tyrosinase family protein [Bacillus wiedmannii]HDR7945860.1 tyrosinase family protein [Bacillus wiedmannii]
MTWKHAAHKHFNLFSEINLDSEKAGDELESLFSSTDFTDEIKPEFMHLTAEAAVQIVRKDQKNFEENDVAAFKNAVNKLIQDGIYNDLVGFHADMSHNMHGSMGPIGLLRFLGWHRRYLLAFEEALQNADHLLRPEAETLISVPYWRWVDPFPEWLQEFLPFPDPRTGGPVPPRTLSGSELKPSSSDIHFIINSFEQQLPGSNVDGYTKFTYGLEGFGRRSDNSRLPAHNQIHAWVGGIMNDTSYSPSDPVFWLHHAEVDRLWHIWQKQHPDLHPALTGNDSIMDPWTESYNQLGSITMLGYSYQSESL